MSNKNLKKAFKRRYDEYYTRYVDIEKEVIHYKDELKGKSIYCNCDSPSSEFVRYFTTNFQSLGIKSITATGYNEGGNGTYFFYDGQKTVNSSLTGEGSFDSQECLDILKNSDIIITNPPFSKLLKYFSILDQEKKDFLIVGTILNFTNSTSIPMLLRGELKTGVNKQQPKFFYVGDSFIPERPGIIKTLEGKRATAMGNTTWITNMKADIENQPMTLTETYDPKKCRKYDNISDIIIVDKVKEIPKDYYDKMAVPVTFMNSYCPEQFEILDVVGRNRAIVNGKEIFLRIVIRRKNTPKNP